MWIGSGLYSGLHSMCDQSPNDVLCRTASDPSMFSYEGSGIPVATPCSGVFTFTSQPLETYVAATFKGCFSAQAHAVTS